MKKSSTYGTEYNYKGFYIYKITRRDFVVFGNDGMVMIDATTLKEAKAELDKISEEN